MKSFLISLILFSTLPGFTQSAFEWQEDRELSLGDFKSPETEINQNLTSYSIFPGSTVQFGYVMTNAEFAFRKNFNEMVVCEFHPGSAAIIAPDSSYADQLLRTEQYNFDLHELYARRFRAELFRQKKFMSRADFFQSIWTDLQKEMVSEYSRMMKETEMGSKIDLLQKLHSEVIQKMEELPDYCRTCKPSKKN